MPRFLKIGASYYFSLSRKRFFPTMKYKNMAHSNDPLRIVLNPIFLKVFFVALLNIACYAILFPTSLFGT